MTNTCNDCRRKLNSANCTIDTSHVNRMCDDCYDLAGLEAAHQDGDHDDAANVDCLICDPNARADRSRKGSQRVAKGRIDHRPCYAAGVHEKSFQGREACRAAGGPGAELPVHDAGDYREPNTGEVI